MTCDRFHFLQEFLHFNGKANSSYDPNDGRRGCCHKRLCRKLCDMPAPERTPFSQIFFPLMVTRGIPPVSRNNDTIKRLSYVKYFS